MLNPLRYFRRRLAQHRATQPQTPPQASEEAPTTKPKPDWIEAADRIHAEGAAKRQRIAAICDARRREAALLKGGRIVTADNDTTMVRSKEVH